MSAIEQHSEMSGRYEAKPSAPMRHTRQKLGSHDVWTLAVILVAAVIAWGFIELAEAVLEGEAKVFDERVLNVIRGPDTSGPPQGPGWLVEAGRDITALGGPAVMTIVTTITVMYLLLQRQYSAAGIVLIAIVSGLLLSQILKLYFARERPLIDTPMVWVTTHSFPSGHAKMSAVVYLSVGALLAEVTTSRRNKVYFIGVAVLLMVMVGVSRVYLGVHYPSDVLAGWIAGLAWTLAWWVVASRYHRGCNRRTG